MKYQASVDGEQEIMSCFLATKLPSVVFWKPTGLIFLELGTIRDTVSHTVPEKPWRPTFRHWRRDSS